MKRPHLVHFLAITTDDFINIKASITMKENHLAYPAPSKALPILPKLPQDLEKEMPKAPRFPIQALRLLNAYEFQLKIVGYDEQHNEIYKKTFESDSFGNLNLKIPLNEERKKICVLQLYEVGKKSGLELVLGTYIPLRITKPKKIVICDFDKTLVDTKYSTTKEVYTSLTQPLDYFPTVPESVRIIRSYIEKGFHPFILSASPHFYEDAMRDWLYQNHIYTAGIFLKDYRQVFSLFESDLTPKDLKAQGMYKVNHILDILLMTGIPDELVLMGDNFESDPLIYMSMAMLLQRKMKPWNLWNLVKQQKAFQMNRKQDSQLLNKIYQLSNIQDRWRQSNSEDITLRIFIRKKGSEEEVECPREFVSTKALIKLYEGHPDSGQKEAGSEEQNVSHAEEESHAMKPS